jgi:trans-aconitate methyltransferase
MNENDARTFIADAIASTTGVWADVGAGSGTFTQALRSLLAPDSRIYAIDNDPAAIDSLGKLGAGVVPINADFSADLSLPEPLDGLLFANALHFVPNASAILHRMVKLLKSDGRVVIVEYDRRSANPWVPYPIPSTHWPQLAEAAGLRNPEITARRKSEYAGELYVAVASMS